MNTPRTPDGAPGEAPSEGSDVGTNELVDVAAALGWRLEAVEQLLAESEQQDALRQIVAVGTDLRDVTPVPEATLARWTAALDAEVRAPGSSTSEPAAQGPAKTQPGLADAMRSLVVGGAAAATMLFALLSTGAWQLRSPAPVLAVATLVGLFACARELTRSPSEGTLLPPRNRRRMST